MVDRQQAASKADAWVCSRGHFNSESGPCRCQVTTRVITARYGWPDDPNAPRWVERRPCMYTTFHIRDLPDAVHAAWLLGGLEAAVPAWETWFRRKVPT